MSPTLFDAGVLLAFQLLYSPCVEPKEKASPGVTTGGHPGYSRVGEQGQGSRHAAGRHHGSVSDFDAMGT